MTDTLTDFYNDSPTYAELQAGKTLLTNAAGEAAVVRDVQVTATNRVALRLKVGATEVGRITGSGTLSGSEIVGADSSLTIDTPLRPIVNKVGFFPQSGSSAKMLRLPTRWSGGGALGGAAELSSTTITAATATAYFAAIGADGALYYANNSTSSAALYKRAGGVAGTQTTVDAAFGHRVCWDGERYIYGVTDNSMILKRLDTTTGTVTSTTITGLSASVSYNYAVVAACDGYLMLRPNNGSNVSIVNATSGVATNLGVTLLSSSQVFVGIYKTASGAYFGLATDSSTAIRKYSFGASLSTPEVKAIEILAIDGSTDAAQYNGLLPSAPGADTAILVDQSNTNSKITLIDLPSGTVLSSAAATTTGNSSMTPYAVPVDATLAVADFGSVAVRATGIKTS